MKENSKEKPMRNLLKNMVERFFYIISITEGKNKKIYNTEVIEEIKEEILRLEKE